MGSKQRKTSLHRRVRREKDFTQSGLVHFACLANHDQYNL